MKISVIVAVFNVQDYLEQCLLSLSKQTYKNLEVIIVNDGSTDHSQKIIDQYTEKYSFMKGLKKSNGGLSDARNYGISYASGDYIAFVDGDDIVCETMYEDLAHKLEEYPYDLVVCDFVEVYPNRNKNGSCNLDKDIKSLDDIKKAMNMIYPSAWNKLYKKEIFNKIQFKKNVWFEDVEFCYRMFLFITSIGVVKKPLYYYIQREGSISKSIDFRIYHTIENWLGILKFYKDNQAFDIYKKELEYSFVRYVYATFIKSATKFPPKEFDKAVNFAISSVKQNFPHYRHNSYFYKSFKGIYLVTFHPFYAKLIYKKINHK